MLRIKIIGTACAECEQFEALVRQALDEMHAEAEISLIYDYDEIRQYPIMSTPALIVNDRIMCDGRVPSAEELISWLK